MFRAAWMCPANASIETAVKSAVVVLAMIVSPRPHGGSLWNRGKQLASPRNRCIANRSFALSLGEQQPHSDRAGPPSRPDGGLFSFSRGTQWTQSGGRGGAFATGSEKGGLSQQNLAGGQTPS